MPFLDEETGQMMHEFFCPDCNETFVAEDAEYASCPTCCEEVHRGDNQ